MDVFNIQWDIRVRRAGFLQAKEINTEALAIPIQLTENITVEYKNIAWVNNYNLYDEKQSLLFTEKFEQAFEKDTRWPLRIIEFFDNLTPKVLHHVEILENTDWKTKTPEEQVSAFLGYVQLMKQVQKHYVIAVPLTNYCEQHVPEEERIAVPYKPLEIDTFQDSLENDTREEHLHKFRWIKTTYNIVHKYTEADVQEGITHTSTVSPTSSPHSVGLRVGIYARNRMKELSQQLWYAIERLASAMAERLNVTRDEFFSMTYNEVVNQEKVNTKERDSFFIGIIDGENVLITSSKVKEIQEKILNTETSSELTGTCACKGIATGTVKIIRDIRDFDKFEQDDILVTSMTTPEFVIIMKKAAAIVTDEGGLSCHAAIVSRELGIPCIIGTKHATRTLENGNLIEVDATNGRVKKQ